MGFWVDEVMIALGFWCLGLCKAVAPLKSLSRDPLKLTLSRYDVFDWLVMFCDYTSWSYRLPKLVFFFFLISHVLLWCSVYIGDAFVLLSSVSLWLMNYITNTSLLVYLSIWALFPSGFKLQNMYCHLPASKGLLFFFCRSQVSQVQTLPKLRPSLVRFVSWVTLLEELNLSDLVWVWCSGSKGLLFFFCRSQALSSSNPLQAQDLSSSNPLKLSLSLVRFFLYMSRPVIER